MRWLEHLLREILNYPLHILPHLQVRINQSQSDRSAFASCQPEAALLAEISRVEPFISTGSTLKRAWPPTKWRVVHPHFRESEKGEWAGRSQIVSRTCKAIPIPWPHLIPRESTRILLTVAKTTNISCFESYVPIIRFTFWGRLRLSAGPAYPY